MKPTDLMIKDWVLYGNVYSKVWCLDEASDLVGLDLPDNMSTQDAHFEDIFPIPLTQEILEKNGFVKNRGVTSWKFETDREDLIDIYGVNEYHLSINIEDTHGSGKGYRWMLNNLTIFYVHQLQHALRLCGIDKEIEL